MSDSRIRRFPVPAGTADKRQKGGAELSSKRIRKLTSIVFAIIDKFTKDNITLYSAQTAYFVVVSMIPFVAVLIPLLTILIPDDTVELIQSVILILPGDLGSIVNMVLDRLLRVPSSSTISLYVIVSLWAASKGIMSLQNGLHGIYHVKETEGYFIRRIRCTLYTLVFLAAIVLALGLLVLGNTIERLLLENFSFWGYLAKAILAFRTLISGAVFVLAFTAGYKYLAGTYCTFRDAFPGVMITTVGWVVFSGLFGLYITHLSRFITLYGSLGALVLLFLWLYFCIVILMIGAEFNVFHAEWRIRRRKSQADEEDAYLSEEETRAGQLLREYIDDLKADIDTDEEDPVSDDDI